MPRPPPRSQQPYLVWDLVSGSAISCPCLPPATHGPPHCPLELAPQLFQVYRAVRFGDWSPCRPGLESWLLT